MPLQHLVCVHQEDVLRSAPITRHSPSTVRTVMHSSTTQIVLECPAHTARHARVMLRDNVDIGTKALRSVLESHPELVMRPMIHAAHSLLANLASISSHHVRGPEGWQENVTVTMQQVLGDAMASSRWAMPHSLLFILCCVLDSQGGSSAAARGEVPSVIWSPGHGPRTRGSHRTEIHLMGAARGSVVFVVCQVKHRDML